jgi:Ca2+-binding EF-hand superfamily protein
LDKELEIARETLSLCQDFSCLRAFKIFDKENKGQLVSKHFITAMEELGIDVHPSELHALFLKYDSNKDEKLTLTEFARIFIPRSSIYAKKMEYKGQIAL